MAHNSFDLAGHLRREIERRGLQDREEIASFIASERNRYWQYLVSHESSDARRKASLAAFDQESLQLQRSFPSKPPPQLHHVSAAKRIPRDMLMVFIGAAIAVPGTIVANYLSGWLFPQATTVSVENVGVQGLMAPRKEFVFLSPTAPGPRDGAIEVNYGMGVDPSKYKCSVQVSEPRHFSEITFDQTCRIVKFRFINQGLMFSQAKELGIGYNNTAIFSIEIKSPDGKVWRGSQGIEYSVNDIKLLQ